MATQYGIQFAVHLITSHFGNLVSKVCENLLRRGPQTLQVLIRVTELTPMQVKNSLLILIQHNCVQSFSSEHIGGGGNEIRLTQYMVLFENIIHRLRFPKFLAIVSQELDKNCEQILEGLLQHGRLTFEQICERAKSSRSEGDSGVRESVKESFHKLLNARFVERCPAPEPFIEPPSEPTSGKRGSKAARFAEASEVTEQHRILEAAAPMEVLRFSVLTTDIDAEIDETDSPTANSGEKRKRIDSDDEFGFKDKEVVLWRANFEEFIRCLRHKACVENVRARMDDGTATVLKAMLDATRIMEKKIRTENSVPLSMNTIFEEVMKSEAGRSLTLDRVRASLVQLGCPPSGIDETYSIDLKKIIELSQSEEVESIVLNRYGRDAYRMFRLLSKAGQLLETEKIADMTFVEKKETPKILYKLWNDEYLVLEKLVLTGVKQSTFHLWKVNKSFLWKHVLNEMYHAALNLSLRVIHEQEQKKELLNLPQEKRTGALEEEFKKLRNVKIYLESSLMKLDDALMLFHNF